MDSNKDFIHIDELFKNIHTSETEHFRKEEAWANMKTLLDKEMPEGVVINGRSRRKYFYPTLTLLMGLGVGATAYFYLNNSNSIAKNNTLAQVINEPLQTSYNNEAHNSAVVYTTPTNLVASQHQNKEAIVENAYIQHSLDKKQQQSQSITNTASGIKNNAKTIVISSNTKDDITQKLNNNQHNIAITLNDLNSGPSASNSVDIEQKNSTITISTEKLTTSNFNPNTLETDKSVTPENTIASNKKINNTQKLTSTTSIPNVKTNNDITILNNETQTQTAKTISSSNKNTNHTIASNTIIEENGQLYIQKEIPSKLINKATVIDPNTHKPTTIVKSEEDIIVTKLVPIPVEEPSTLGTNANAIVNSGTSNILNTTENITKTENTFTDLKSLNDSKVKTINTHNKSDNFFKNYIKKDDILKFINRPNKFEAMLNFGGLYSPAANGSYGFSLGIGILYELNERISVGIEGKYVRKIFSNFYQNDMETIYDIQQNGAMYSGTKTHTDYQYTIKNYTSFELPLYMRYNVGDRISVFGGLQYVFAAPIKWDKTVNETVDLYYNSIEKPNNYYAVINTNTDFAKRSGWGYLVGIGFDASKSISLDLRVSQNFYNRKNIASNVINSIYNQPVFSLTFSYCIGKKDKIYYLINNKK